MDNVPRLNLEVVQQVINETGCPINEWKNKKDSWFNPRIVATACCGTAELSQFDPDSHEMDILKVVGHAVQSSRGLIYYFNNTNYKSLLSKMERLGFSLTWFKNPVHGGRALCKAELYIDDLRWATLLDMKPVQTAAARTTSRGTTTDQRSALAAATTKKRVARDAYGRFAPK